MPKLTPLKAGEVMRKLRALGFEGPIPGGRHAHMIHRAKKKVIPVPTHGGKDIGIGRAAQAGSAAGRGGGVAAGDGEVKIVD